MLTTGWLAVGLMALMIVAMMTEGEAGESGTQEAEGESGTQEAEGENDPLAGLSAEQRAAIEARIAKERDRLDMKYKTAAEKAREEAKAAAKAELEEERRKAEMSELEKLQEEKAELEAAREAEKQRAAELEAELARAEFMAANAGDLPQAYRAQVQGEDEDALAESLKAAREQWENDLAAATGNRQSNVGGRSRPGGAGQPGGAPQPAGDGSSIDDYLVTP